MVPVVVSGGIAIYDIPDTFTPSDIVAIPSLAGKTFNLEVDGRAKRPRTTIDPTPPGPGEEFQILGSGGAQLVNGDQFQPGQRLKFEIHGAVVPGPGTTSGSALVTGGQKIVNANYTIDPVADKHKIFSFRSNASQVTLTLADIADVVVDSIIPIEATINNAVENKVQTTGGQLIYYNNTSSTAIYLRPGNSVWLYRSSSGYHVIDQGFSSMYNDIGMIQSRYKIALNQLLCNGQEVLRSDYPRLWAMVQTFGASLVSEATWQTASVVVAGRTVERPYRGCFSTGDGSTTFRLPDMMNMALRGVKTIGGSDTERHLNAAGGFQKNEVIQHAHQSTVDGFWNESGTGHIASGGNSNEGPGTSPMTGNYGGAETRMDNIGILWTINV